MGIASHWGQQALALESDSEDVMYFTGSGKWPQNVTELVRDTSILHFNLFELKGLHLNTQQNKTHVYESGKEQKEGNINRRSRRRAQLIFKQKDKTAELKNTLRIKHNRDHD